MKNAVSPSEAIERLKRGNARLLSGKTEADISPEIRKETFLNGQAPFAAVITCSDSRVIPEYIFDAGIGELFVIRTAGNTVGAGELGSVEYAAEHLGCRLVLVLGHDGCGAALSGKQTGHVAAITDVISEAAKGAEDERAACIMNIKNSMRVLSENIPGITAAGAVYHTESGEVEFLQT